MSERLEDGKYSSCIGRTNRCIATFPKGFCLIVFGGSRRVRLANLLMNNFAGFPDMALRLLEPGQQQRTRGLLKRELGQRVISYFLGGPNSSIEYKC
jgi:hypothetical protein